MRSLKIDSGARVLLIRTGSLFEEDPVEEISSLLKEHTKAAFAKFGKPLGANFIKRMKPEGHQTYLGVFRSKVDYDQVNVFPIHSIHQSQPAGVAFPRYYRKQIAHISTWIVLKNEPRWGRIGLDELIVASSRNKARAALGSSMASHYLCLFKPQPKAD